MQTKVELYILVGTSFPVPFWLPVHSGQSMTWQRCKSEHASIPWILHHLQLSEQLQRLKCLLAFQEDCQEAWMLSTATRQDLTRTCTHWRVVITWQASCWLWLSGTRHSGMLLAAINPGVLLHWLDLEVVLMFSLMLLRCLEGNLTGEHCFLQRGAGRAQPQLWNTGRGTNSLHHQQPSMTGSLQWKINKLRVIMCFL